MTKERAVIELIFAGIIWGFGFIATKYALTSFSIYELLCFRFFIAFIAGEIIYFLFFKRKTSVFNYAKELKLTLPAGFFYGGIYYSPNHWFGFNDRDQERISDDPLHRYRSIC